MKKHIIVEGMDGSGKTTLIRELLKYLTPSYPGYSHYAKHERASSSVDGPVKQLDQWVIDDTRLMPFLAPSIYDRHPLISEPIYGPICRGGVLGRFRVDSWVEIMRQSVANYALVIWCHPPLDNIRQVIGNEEQMAGVVDNLDRLHKEYARAMLVWPGAKIMYDRTKSNHTELINRLRTINGGPRVR